MSLLSTIVKDEHNNCKLDVIELNIFELVICYACSSCLPLQLLLFGRLTKTPCLSALCHMQLLSTIVYLGSFPFVIMVGVACHSLSTNRPGADRKPDREPDGPF